VTKVRGSARHTAEGRMRHDNVMSQQNSTTVQQAATPAALTS